MNPDIHSYEYHVAQGRAERREREAIRKHSRESQPRRKDYIKGHR